MTIPAALARARRLAQETELTLVIVDYVQLLGTAAGGDRGRTREQEVSANSRGCKQLARELNVPVLALAQVNRRAEDRPGPPLLSDLRESGSLEQDSDVVVFLSRHPDAPDHQEQVLLTVAKNRNGALGATWLDFDGPTTTFTEGPPAGRGRPVPRPAAGRA